MEDFSCIYLKMNLILEPVQPDSSRDWNLMYPQYRGSFPTHRPQPSVEKPALGERGTWLASPFISPLRLVAQDPVSVNCNYSFILMTTIHLGTQPRPMIDLIWFSQQPAGW